MRLFREGTGRVRSRLARYQPAELRLTKRPPPVKFRVHILLGRSETGMLGVSDVVLRFGLLAFYLSRFLTF